MSLQIYKIKRFNNCLFYCSRTFPNIFSIGVLGELLGEKNTFFGFKAQAVGPKQKLMSYS